MNKETFFNHIRRSLFGGSLNQNQVDSINHILVECKANNVCDNRKVAYIIATAYHEVGRNLQPVREGFAASTQGAIDAVTRLFNSGKISRNYALPVNGKSYFGRGLVQLTHDFNYKLAGEKLGIDLLNNPDLALKPDIAAKILVRGMVEGWFTGRKLEQYFNDATTDWSGARRIVNGTDRAALIGGYAKEFYMAMNG